MKKILAIALVAVLALSLLTACGGNDNGGGNSTNPPNNSTPSGNGGNNSTPTPGGNDNSGGSAENYPDYWNDEIPKMNGKVTFDIQSGNGATITLNAKNEDVINAYIDSLISDGYEKTSDTKNNNRVVILENGTWAISISYGNDLKVTLDYAPDNIN